MSKKETYFTNKWNRRNIILLVNFFNWETNKSKNNKIIEEGSVEDMKNDIKKKDSIGTIELKKILENKDKFVYLIITNTTQTIKVIDKNNFLNNSFLVI